MGDRANIFVVQHPKREAEGGIFIYSHWGGHEMPGLLQAALKRGQPRWDDEPYLTRIIIDEISKTGDATCGVGVTTYITDNEWPVLVVDNEKQTVSVAPRPNGDGQYNPLALERYNETSFTKYVELDDKAIDRFRDKP